MRGLKKSAKFVSSNFNTIYCVQLTAYYRRLVNKFGNLHATYCTVLSLPAIPIALLIFYVDLPFSKAPKIRHCCFSEVYYVKIVRQPEIDAVFEQNNFCIQIIETPFAAQFLASGRMRPEQSNIF